MSESENSSNKDAPSSAALLLSSPSGFLEYKVYFSIHLFSKLKYLFKSLIYFQLKFHYFNCVLIISYIVILVGDALCIMQLAVKVLVQK